MDGDTTDASRGHRAEWLVGALSALPLLVWWASWFPGMLSPVAVAEYSEAVSGSFSNEIPAAHGIAIWLLTRVWRSPAPVTLLQVAALVALLVVFVRRAPDVGIPRRLAAVVAVLFAWLPAVGVTVIAVEVQVVQALAYLWLFVEVLGIAPDPASRLAERGSAIRLGLALGVALLVDHAGVVAVVLVAGLLALGLGKGRSALAGPLGVALALFVAVQGPVYALAGVDRGIAPLGEVYAPEIAAVYADDPASFGTAQVALLETVAALEVWEDAYRCEDGRALVEDREFDRSAIRADPGAYRDLLVRSALRSPLAVAGHRLCAAGFLFVPAQPVGERFGTYAYNIPPNDAGVSRDSLVEPGFNATKAILVRIDQPDRLWLFWRAGIVVWPAVLGLGLLALRRRPTWAGIVPLAVLATAVMTVRTPSFVEAFPLYAVSFISLAQWWPAVTHRR